MADRSNRWVMLWVLIMLLSLMVGGLYVRANLPPLPGVYWLAPYPAPSERSVADLRREAESAPAYLQALRVAKEARTSAVLQAMALWIAGGAALFVAGRAVRRSFHPEWRLIRRRRTSILR